MSKIDTLKQLIKKNHIEAYLIPHTDEFQSEYTAPYAERLRYITGFTGSAGFAIVGLDKAAFFTDGRYILQAQDEIDANEFEVHHIGETPPFEWLRSYIPGAVGFDPWLFTPHQLKRFENQLTPIQPNLVDLVWNEEQPQRPKDKAFVHPLSFTGETHTEKCKRVGQSLHAEKALITSPDSIAWLLNIRGDDVLHTPVVLSYALLDKDGTCDLFVDLDKINNQVYAHVSQKGRVIGINHISEHLAPKGLPGSIQYDPLTTPVALIEMLDGVSVTHKPDPCQLPKAIKNDVEIDGMRSSHIRDGVALVKFMSWLEKQPLAGETTEWSASERLQTLRAEGQHFYGLSFDTISGYGPHGAIIHYRVTPETSLPITRDSLYLVDSGAQYFDGTTDVTRTLCLGDPTSEQRDNYTRVLKGHIALAQTYFPKGTTGGQLDVLARKALWDVGLDYDHGTGHGVGSFLGVHEGPQGISKRPQDTSLEPGMILSNEPGYYKEGEYGIRIESLVVVKEAPIVSKKPYFCFETLTMAPLEKKLIDATQLAKDEIQWINNYHQTVLKTLSPHLSEAHQSWLNHATENI